MTELHPITESIHYIVSKIIREYSSVESVIDMGGMGKLGKFLDCKVIDANIKNGIDACNLPFDDKSFDVACSLSTLEHVQDQRAFLRESIRVARKGIVHWFPYGEAAIKMEEFRKTLPYKHPCVVPSVKLITDFLESHPSLELTKYINCESQLLLLTTLVPQLKIPKVYDMSFAMGKSMYGVILHGRI